MSTTWHYDVGLALDDQGNPLAGVTGKFRVATDNGPGDFANVFDTSGSPATIKTSEKGTFSRFNLPASDEALVATNPGAAGAWGYIDWNGIIQPVASIEVLNALPAARAAQAAAERAQSAAETAAAAAAAAAGGGGSGGSGWDVEQTQDVIGPILVQQGWTYNDAANTFTPPAAYDPTGAAAGEAFQDFLGPILQQAGWTYNDAANTFTPPAAGSGLADGSVTTSKYADASINDIKIVANRYLVGSTGATESIQDMLGNSFLVGGSYDDVNNLYNLPTGSGSSAFGTLIYCIPASDLVAWPAAGTDAQKMAAINANDARIVHELVTRPGYRIEADPSQWWPCSLVIDEFVGTYTKPDGTTGNLVEGADYALGGRFLLCKGTRTSSTDTAASVIQSGPVLSVTRKHANNAVVVTPTNLRAVQLGGTPNLGSYFTAVCSGFDATTGLSLYKAGQVGDLVSQETYGYSDRAGYADGVYKGAFFPVAGLAINVTGYSLTAMNTAIGSGTVTTLERRTLVGATSGVTALVQGGDFGANGQLLVNSVSGDWTAGEQLKDQATGAVVATYSSTTVCMRGLLNCDYTTAVQFRFVTSSKLDVGRIMMKPDGDIDAVIESYNRPDLMFLTGCTNVNLDGFTALGGYSSGIGLRSCYDITGLVHIRDLPNHALESLAERAYGYGVRLLGHTQNFRIGLDVQRVRHGVTSNAIRGSWNLNARTGSTTGATSLCTNFWNHGPGARYGTLYGKVENTWSACWDFHEGAEFITLDHPQAIQPVGSGRATTSPDGFSIRGFGITVIGAYAEGCRLGIYDLAGPLNSGGLAYTNTYIGGVFKRCQAGGYMQSEDTFDESLASVDIRDNVFTCDPAAKGAYAQQFGMLLRRGNTSVTGNKLRSIGYAMFRLTSFVGSNGSNATGHVLIRGNELDWTDSSASRPFSAEATYDEITEVNNHARVNPVAGTQRPTVWLVNSAGDSNYRYGGRTTSHLSSTKSDPSSTPTISAGAPTIVSIDPAAGSSTPATHSIAVLPTVAAGPGISTGAAGTASLNQTDLVSTDLYGEVKFGAATSGGTANTAGDVLFTVTFGTPFQTVPTVHLQPGNITTGGRGVPFVGVVDVTKNGFSARVTQAIAAGAGGFRLIYDVTGV